MISDKEIHDAVRDMTVIEIKEKYNLKNNDELRARFVDEFAEVIKEKIMEWL